MHNQKCIKSLQSLPGNVVNPEASRHVQPPRQTW